MLILRKFEFYLLTVNLLFWFPVVTGASRGIGEAFAHALGEKGFNLVLISRTKNALEEVANQIRSVTFC
jgi:short-subunit dehydrogenase